MFIMTCFFKVVWLKCGQESKMGLLWCVKLSIYFGSLALIYIPNDLIWRMIQLISLFRSLRGCLLFLAGICFFIWLCLLWGFLFDIFKFYISCLWFAWRGASFFNLWAMIFINCYIDDFNYSVEPLIVTSISFSFARITNKDVFFYSRIRLSCFLIFPFNAAFATFVGLPLHSSYGVIPKLLPSKPLFKIYIVLSIAWAENLLFNFESFNIVMAISSTTPFFLWTTPFCYSVLIVKNYLFIPCSSKNHWNDLDVNSQLLSNIKHFNFKSISFSTISL